MFSVQNCANLEINKYILLFKKKKKKEEVMAWWHLFLSPNPADPVVGVEALFYYHK